MLRELVAEPHCIHVYSSCKVTMKYVYTIGGDSVTDGQTDGWINLLIPPEGHMRSGVKYNIALIHPYHAGKSYSKFKFHPVV